MSHSDFRSKFTSIFKLTLPGKKAHSLFTPNGRPIDFELITDKELYRKSAVALILFEEQNEIKFILIQRSTYNGSHSGQIGLPGGKFEDSDFHLENTARRETFEEIGILLDETHLLGKLSEIFIPVSKFMIQPYVYFLSEPPIFKLDRREVEELIIEVVSEIMKSDALKYGSIHILEDQTLKNVPHFHLSQKQVWGATALILGEFITLLKSNE